MCRLPLPNVYQIRYTTMAMLVMAGVGSNPPWRAAGGKRRPAFCASRSLTDRPVFDGPLCLRESANPKQLAFLLGTLGWRLPRAARKGAGLRKETGKKTRCRGG